MTDTALPLADSPLGRTVATTATDIWNDSCSIPELEYAISFGAVGATANPTIVSDVWKQEPARWQHRVEQLARERPAATVADLAWAVVRDMSVAGARLLEPAFGRSGGRLGRLSVQTDPTLYRTPDAMVAQSLEFTGFAPNIIVKFPATAAGITAIEAATARGVSVNVTVCFSVAQAIAAAEAIERGLRQREQAGEQTATMGPVVTVMMGRIEDWLHVQAERDGIVVDPDVLAWSGVAVIKRAYEAFGLRGFRARVLGAAIRHHLHWSELIGGDLAITVPANWQRRFNASEVEVRPRIDDPIEPRVLDQLSRSFPDFVRAYDPDGLPVAEFDAFPPTVRTLRAFIRSYDELLLAVSDVLLPNPDVKRA